MGQTGEQLRPCYVSLSQTYKDNKQYDLAIKYFKEELKLNSNNPFEVCYHNVYLEHHIRLYTTNVICTFHLSSTSNILYSLQIV